MSGFDGAIAIHPMLKVPCLSKIESKWVPASTVFQRPPLAVRT